MRPGRSVAGTPISAPRRVRPIDVPRWHADGCRPRESARAGIWKGDVILDLEKQVPRDGRHLSEIIQSFAVGSVVKVRLLRGGKTSTVNATLERRTPR